MGQNRDGAALVKPLCGIPKTHYAIGRGAWDLPRRLSARDTGRPAGWLRPSSSIGVSEGSYCTEGATAGRALLPWGLGSGAPAEAVIILAMHLVTVVGGRVVAHRLAARLDLDDLGGTQRFQHGIEPLAGSLQHLTQSRDGDTCRRRAQTDRGGVELLPQDLRVQQAGQLLLLVQPVS
jgi:hypothetical protein